MNLAELIKLSIKGNSSAQKQLYESFAGSMLGVCYRYTKSKEDAEDVLQEGFIKMFHHLDKYDHKGAFGGWLRRIMVNTSINYLKKNARYNRDMVFNDIELVPVSKLSSDENLESDLNARQLASLLRQLPVGYQTIFNLHAIEGYSHVEIGKLLGITDSTSRTQFFKARNLLMKWIKETESATIKMDKDAG